MDMTPLIDLKEKTIIINMSDADFKLFDIMRDRMDVCENVVDLCDHEYVSDGVCDSCFRILYQVNVSDVGSYLRASPSYVSKHSRVNHFMKILDKRDGLTCEEYHLIIHDFENFIWAFDRIDKGNRKNSLLNNWVLWRISKRRGIKCKRYEIKGMKSREEHERLGKLVFDKLKWSKEIKSLCK